MKNIVKIFLLALITVVIGIFFIKRNYDNTIEKPNSNTSETVTVQILQGQSVESIIDNLVEKGLLKKEWTNYFKIYLKLNNLAKNIQAGTYEIPKNLNIKEIAYTIQQATGQDTWITIPEGLRKDEIAQILYENLSSTNNKLFNKEEFLSLTTDTRFISTLGFNYEITNLEGYLFPDKYAFSKDTTTQNVLERLILNFQEKAKDISYEDLIIASMVEREGYTAEDRAIIADVIKKRLAEGWLLQIDATLLYPKKDWEYIITETDKENENPYNTYKYPGLPPTPICNPGLESIKATLTPESNNYYFYIHDTNGNAYFAETLAEHNRNVQKYLR
jgi:UPF0755 protein